MAGNCDSCTEMVNLLSKFNDNCIDDEEVSTSIEKNDLNVLINYINVWNQKHCFCFLKDHLNLLHFNNLVQSIITTSFNLLKEILNSIQEIDIETIHIGQFDDWTNEDKEKLFQLKAKIYQLSFPLYVAYKHSTINKNEELSASDKRNIAQYCDLSEYDMPSFLLRKIIYFIESDGMTLYASVINEANPSNVSIVFVHSMICVIQSIKQYFNPTYINIKLVAIRTNVINYLCKMQDNDLRIVSNRTMFEYVWSVVKEYNSFNQFSIDKDGLKIALKYFNSSTLTMRLSGIAQINNYIALYNDMHHNASKLMSEQLNQWIIDNNIIENIFGPHLHVEILKQSHFILSCTSLKITTEHIDIIWGSAQIKHYERYIFEILSQLVKNFNVQTVLYLYNLLWKTKAKDHSEHTLNLASQIIKYIWSHNNIQSDMITSIHYIPNEKPLLEETTFNKNALYSFFRSEPMAKTSSNTSGSSVEVSDDEEEEEDFDIDIGSQRLGSVMEKGQLSKLNSDESSNNSSESEIDELSEYAKENIARGFKSKMEYPIIQGMELGFENDISEEKTKKDKNLNKNHKNSPNDESYNEMETVIDSIYEDGDIFKTCYNFARSQVTARRSDLRPSTVDTFSDYVFRIDDVCKPGNTILWDILQDKMLNELSEETYLSAEKIFWNTIVCASNRTVRRIFIFACLDNLTNNYSVLTSIRLLMKLFGSFQHLDGRNVRKLLFEADMKKNMMKSFFNNLNLFMSCCKLKNSQFNSLKSRFHSQKEEIQYRLNFLSYVYCFGGSYDGLSFSQEHINILWNVFTTSEYPEIVEEFFNWLLKQVKGNILSTELIAYILVEKMPLLPSEAFSLTSLDLLHNLHGLVLSKSCQDKCQSVKYLVHILWSVAFQNPNSDVSSTAIRNLNSYYISLLSCSNNFDTEEEFISLCIKHLKNASILLPIDCDRSLVIIDRAVILLKNHLEVFQARYSYFFRKLKLTSDLDLTIHRLREKSDTIMRFWVVSPYNSDKKLFEFSPTEHIGDLRAEVQFWWNSIFNKTINNSLETLICLVYHSLENRDLEKEIPFEDDYKRLCEFDFKENVINQISFHTRKNSLTKSCDINPLSFSSEFLNAFKLKNSKTLLLESGSFELLFTLMQQLDMINITKLKARILSRNIWEIVQMLPTSAEILNRFKQLTTTYNKKYETFQLNESVNEYEILYEKIFQSNSNQKLIYCCQLVDFFRRTNKIWPQIFIDTGGLNFLFKLFIDKVDSIRYSREWTEWKQDCLASLVQTIYQFAIFNIENFRSLGEERINEYCLPFINPEGGSRKSKRSRKSSLEKNTIFMFNSKFLSMITNPEKLVRVLLSILKHVSSNCKLVYPTAYWTRAQVVYFNLTFLTSWCYSDVNVFNVFFRDDNMKDTIQRLILDDSDQVVRKEACIAFDRLCLGSSTEGKDVRDFAPKFMNLLISFIEYASKVNIETITLNANRSIEEKTLSGPGCKDYFLLVCRMVEVLMNQNSEIQLDIDINELCQFLAENILKRENYEIRNNGVEDEGLRGLIVLLSTLIKHNSSFKARKECQEFILEIFNLLFLLPTQSQRFLPKCKFESTRSAAFDLLIELVKGNEENFTILSTMLMDQHRHDVIGRSTAYPWEYWPLEEGRSNCATCYMASCMQHLFMLTEVRNCVLSAHLSSVIKHEPILRELQKMFIFLQESERKSYSPKNFCKVYMMDHQPLNICEQKDMTEFFTDLISKMEEMTIDLKDMVKKNFSGSQSNNVVSLDCPHISQTTEEFYTLRCQVADMKDLYESLNELTVKDTLEGDNMYNCSKCGKKVRAEKRACIKKLPKILCFNTMRYTFNMVTMTKEKVNTHFSFPFNLDMAPYLEKNLINITDAHDQSQLENEKSNEVINTKYELIGVTVHTGTAEGGHYYSFIQDRDVNSLSRNRWFLFNDAEVKSFEKANIAAECFGGETTSKQYDQANDKFFDCSIEKTNSAYMLFYERIDDVESPEDDMKIEECSINNGISNSLMNWIWDDNISFLRDQFIFEHSYFDFIWKVCAQVPQTLSTTFSVKATEIAAELATLFLLETLIHAKEKPTIANWIELLTKQFNNSLNACEWLINYLANCDWWSIQILFKCSNQMVRQLFIRLCIHVIVKLKPAPCNALFLHHLNSDGMKTVDRYKCVTRFIRRLLSLIDIDNMSIKPNIKNLTEYFSFLYEFAKQGDEECSFLISIEAISIMINFYLNHTKIMNEFVDHFSDNEDEEFEDRPHIFGQLMEDKVPRMASLDKMIMLIVYLLEKTQSMEKMVLSQRDFESLISGKSFVFIQQQIRDNINPRQTFNLICSLNRLDDSLAPLIINMIFSSIVRTSENTTTFFKILSLMVDNNPVISYFSKLILPRIWEVSQHNSLQTLDWLVQHVPRNKLIHDHVLSTLDNWLPYFLIEETNIRVRSTAAQLVVSLVPSIENSFRQNYRPFRTFPYTINKEIHLVPESLAIVDKLFTYLIGIIKRLKTFSLNQPYGTQKLTNYFFVMSYLLIYTKQKRFFLTHFTEFWTFFSNKLAEPAIAIHQNKQAFLMFWYLACQECPDSIKCIVQNPNVYKKIAFNYILADHEDQDTILFNKNMLPYYYGILRLCCQSSRQFTRYLSHHQNIQWAFQNITPHHNHYQLAVNELFKLMKMFNTVHADSNEDELKEVISFKKNTMKMYLNNLNPNVHWTTLIHVLNILIDSPDDYIFLIQCNGLYSLFQAFSALIIMFHEATACNVTTDLVEVMEMIFTVLGILESQIDKPELVEHRGNLKDFVDIKKFIFLLNTYTPGDVRSCLLKVLTKLTHVAPYDFMKQIATSLLIQHVVFLEHNQFVNGPYFPKRGQKMFQNKSSLRPLRPTFQMCFNPTILETSTTGDKEYERLVSEFYYPYYSFVEDFCRFAAKINFIFTDLVELMFKVADESLYFHCKLFISLVLEINNMDKFECSELFNDVFKGTSAPKEYITHILTRERIFLCDEEVFQFMDIYLPKISRTVLTPLLIKQVLSLIDNFCLSPSWLDLKVAQQIIGDLRAVKLIYLSGMLDNQNEAMLKFVDILKKLKSAYTKLFENETSSDNKMPPIKRVKFDFDQSSCSQDGGGQDKIATTSTTTDECKNSSQISGDHVKLIAVIDEIICLIKSN
ncbi:hypothetical protein RDWZM_009336 [Blomia tropicalis]|uniref:USP domain-containing protein n=1 Tax=Blomia tropicalis TaxID=40697 RepID=A0A9Q0M3H6_BLOTA|nr:hypothetical protein RDWZM_009336 [Blomia tropicalis]